MDFKYEAGSFRSSMHRNKNRALHITRVGAGECGPGHCSFDCDSSGSAMLRINFITKALRTGCRCRGGIAAFPIRCHRIWEGVLRGTGTTEGKGFIGGTF